MSVHVIGYDANNIMRDLNIHNGTKEEVEKKLKELNFTIMTINEYKD